MKVQTLKAGLLARPLMLVVAMAVLSGCGSMQANDDEPYVGAPSSGSVQHSFSDAKVVSLWKSAEEARQRGNSLVAFKYLRQALNLDPSDPVIWSRLAETALRLQKPEPAEKYADRSNQLAGGNNTLMYRNWLIIQRAREENNDIEGAETAQRKANQFRP